MDTSTSVLIVLESIAHLSTSYTYRSTPAKKNTRRVGKLTQKKKKKKSSLIKDVIESQAKL